MHLISQPSFRQNQSMSAYSFLFGRNEKESRWVDKKIYNHVNTSLLWKSQFTCTESEMWVFCFVKPSVHEKPLLVSVSIHHQDKGFARMDIPTQLIQTLMELTTFYHSLACALILRKLPPAAIKKFLTGFLGTNYKLSPQFLSLDWMNLDICTVLLKMLE